MILGPQHVATQRMGFGPPKTEQSQTGLPLQHLGQEGWGFWGQVEVPRYKLLSSGWRAQV